MLKAFRFKVPEMSNNLRSGSRGMFVREKKEARYS